MRQKRLKAEFPGTCYRCGGPIPVGEVMFLSLEGTRHTGCPEAKVTVRRDGHAPKHRRSHTDLEDVVLALGGRTKGYTLKGWLNVHCPFPDHNRGDKHASAGISPDGKLFVCHGCGFEGDKVKLVMEARNLSRTEAVEFIRGLERRTSKGIVAVGTKPSHTFAEEFSRMWKEAAERTRRIMEESP